jgi:Protein of unknown function (DUF2971)
MGGMPIPAEETNRYRQFFLQIARDLDSMAIPPDTTLWHYTHGTALIQIIDSMSIFSTQISCLNDTTELRYASRLFHEALAGLRAEIEGDETKVDFVDRALNYFKENVEFPMQAVAPYFVTCFSDKGDDLSQWRAYGGGENGYAIGFKPGDLLGSPKCILARINYDGELHRSLAQKVATATVQFSFEGVKKYAPVDAAKWSEEFFEAWRPAITMIAPLVKDPAFIEERECRVVRGYCGEISQLKFIQKGSLMSRHLPLRPGTGDASDSYRLPISEVMVGPCRHPEISRTSVETLLCQKGYPTGLVSISRIPFQTT